MTELSETQGDSSPNSVQPYDKRKLSYATTFTNPYKVFVIRTLEWLTGKLPLLYRIRRFERMGAKHGQAFWAQALDVMEIDLQTCADQVAHIPPTGPLVVVANHPHGLVDGMVMAELIGRVRTDYKILTRSLLTGVKEIEEFMLPVPFPHEENSHRLSIEMRNKAMAHLKDGGVIILFPAGAVASSATAFGDVVEKQWNPFTAKMILKSGATVVPIFFPGRNTRLYQIADKVSATIRQGLLLHEIVKSLGKPQAPIIGAPIEKAELERWSSDPRGFMAWLREHTLALGASSKA
ncbi:lysophospholipid acyltransferase family protein [Aquimixticola soesokkakensis]|uniref:lysophospholipid acyltransferase family protein n=1 Tax=Aquimixticola soesokkakensis TaxID=1519096 RepID=UPI000A26E664|nr:lysophospholipid acyltransferase family protein [Aquimixticola soesokkakensis]